MKTLFAGLTKFFLVHRFLSLLLIEFLRSEIIQKSRSVQNTERKIPQFRLTSWCGIFVEKHSVETVPFHTRKQGEMTGFFCSDITNIFAVVIEKSGAVSMFVVL